MSFKPRRPKSMKFHAMAVGIICVVVTLLYFLMVPKEQAPYDPDQASGDRFVRVVDASWGLNCNTEINRLRSQGLTTVGEGDKKRPLTLVQPNNAMYAVTQLCNEKIKCSILATNETMDLDPLSSCYKDLVVGYRCFSVDRKWTRKAEQGTLLAIDCSEGVDQSKPIK